MMLGDLLAEARSASAMLEPALRDELARLNHDPERFARTAVADFERFASAEDWTTLLSLLRRSDDPALACVEAMVRWRLSVPRCGSHDETD